MLVHTGERGRYFGRVTISIGLSPFKIYTVWETAVAL